MTTRRERDNPVTKYTAKLMSQDPNGLGPLVDHECRTTNDYIDWDTLHGPVITYNLWNEVDKNEK